MLRFAVSVCVVILAFAGLLSASSPPAAGGAIRGTVKDSSGAVIPNATVTATDQNGVAHAVKTGADGSYRITGLDSGSYTIETAYTGLQQTKVVLVQVATNNVTQADISMAVKSQMQEITVKETGPGELSTEAANNASAITLKQEDLDALPDDPDDLQADLEALAGPSAGPGGTQIFIDGFTGGRLPPKSSIREIRINSNPFAAENDKLGFGRIDIFTKPGTDKFHGQGYFGTSEGIWDSRNPFLTKEPPFQTQLFGGNVSGPLGSKASFFLDVDRRNIDDNGIVNATLPSATLLGTQSYQTYNPAPQRRTTVSPRVDIQLSPKNTLSLRYAFLGNDQASAGIGSFNLPATTVGSLNLASSGYSQSMSEQLVQVVDTAVLSPSLINESHFQFARDYVSDNSLSTSPQLNVTNSFVSGGSGYTSAAYGSTYDRQNQYELQNYSSLTSGTHTIKFGIRVRADDLKDYSPRNFNGVYTFQGGSSGLSSIQQYLATERLLNAGYSSQEVTAMGYGPSLYTVSTGNPLVNFYQLDFGPFVQDDWRVKSNLTLSFGLRWESQTNINDKNDWAPRVAFAWAPSGGHTKTVIRGGWGMFYDRFQATNVLNAYRYNGVNQVDYVLTNPTMYNAAFSTTPPVSDLQLSNSVQRYEIDNNLKAPRLMQTVLTVERQLFGRTTVNANFINSRGVHELLTDDINAPLPGTYAYNSMTGAASESTGVRPYGNVGDIYDYQSTGIYKQTQLSVGANSSTKWFTVFTRYSYGTAHSNTDGLTTMPSDPYDIGQDWGRSSLDIRQMLFVGGSIRGPWGLRLSPFFIAHSGIPFNITTGTDLYDTGQVAASARPSVVTSAGDNVVLTPFGYLNTVPQAGQSIIERNLGTGPGFLELNMRLSKTWGFGTIKFEGPSGGATAQGGGGPGGPPGGGRPGGGGPPGGGPGGGGPPPGMGGESASHRYNVTLSIMARNVLNHENLSAPVGVLTSPYFLESTGITGGFGPESVASNQRRIDLQLRFAF